MTRALSLADRWRRYWYLQGVELRLDAMPGRRRRAVLAELKANLEIAAAETGMTAALADLGRPVDLARQYLDQEPALRPHWNAGALAAGAVLAAAGSRTESRGCHLRSDRPRRDDRWQASSVAVTLVDGRLHLGPLDDRLGEVA